MRCFPPRFLDFAHRALKDLPVGEAESLGHFFAGCHSRQVIEVGELARDELDRHLAGDLASGVAAHAVRDYE